MSGMNITIEKAVPADAEAWCRIRKECWLDVYPNKEHDITKEDILLKDFDSEEKIQMWRDSFANQTDCRYYSAKTCGKVVGMCLSYPDQPICEIGAIYIDLNYQHQGIGTKLISQAMSDFDQTKKVNLKVVSYNEKAIKFYQKLGFKIVGPFDDPFGKLPNGKQLPETEMIKEVQK